MGCAPWCAQVDSISHLSDLRDADTTFNAGANHTADLPPVAQNRVFLSSCEGRIIREVASGSQALQFVRWPFHRRGVDFSRRKRRGSPSRLNGERSVPQDDPDSPTGHRRTAPSVVEKLFSEFRAICSRRGKGPRKILTQNGVSIYSPVRATEDPFHGRAGGRGELSKDLRLIRLKLSSSNV